MIKHQHQVGFMWGMKSWLTFRNQSVSVADHINRKEEANFSTERRAFNNIQHSFIVKFSANWEHKEIFSAWYQASMWFWFTKIS